MVRLSMRKIREVLRLKYEAGLSARAIARSVNTGRTTVQEHLQRFAASGLSWPTELDDAALESRLFPPPPPAGTARPEPDWTAIQHELRRKGVTLLLLWQEYKEREPTGSSIRGSVTATAPGRVARTWSCGNTTGRESNASSTMRE